jgi:hypothetical protein
MDDPLAVVEGPFQRGCRDPWSHWRSSPVVPLADRLPDALDPSKRVLGLARSVAPMPALLHLTSDVADDADADAFARWCDQHHGEVLHVDGFRTARRYQRLGGRPGRDLLTLYDLDDLAVLESDAYARHGREQTPLPPGLASSLRFGRSTWVRVAGGDAGDAGDAPYLIRVEGHGPGRRFEDADRRVLTLQEADELPPAGGSGWELVYKGP